MGNNILIIGNGFDLYHMLPTRYSDFMFLASEWSTFYSEYSPKEGQSISHSLINVPLSEEGKLTQETLIEFGRHGDIFNKEHIEYLNTELKRNTWIRYFKELENSGEMRWVDFEAEIHKALSAVEEYSMITIPNNVNHIIAASSIPTRLARIPRIFGETARNGYCDMAHRTIRPDDIDKPRLQDNKELLIEFMCQELDKLIMCLDYYLSEFVGNINTIYYSEQINTLRDIELLNFNYTDTYHLIYKNNHIVQYHSVHGGIKNNDIVLGIADDTFEGKPEYIRFQKFFQRIQKKTGSFYLKWLNETNNGFKMRKDVYIMGHSLGYADFGVLEPFFTHPAIRKITIYYHNQKSYEDLVINLVKALGKEKVIDDIGREKIVFEELRNPEKQQ